MKKDQEAAIQSHPSHTANLQFEAMPCFNYRSNDIHILPTVIFWIIIFGHTYEVRR